MRSNYEPLGKYIQEVNNRDREQTVDLLLGVSIQKKFIPSIANIIGTDMSTYKIVKRNQFAYGPVTSRNGDKISIALLEEYDEAIVSQAYSPFELKDQNALDPEYLMMWFRRPEFDRYARFMSHGSAREIFGWEEMCNTMLPVPHIDKQREIVKEYNIIQDRIVLNNQLIKKLEDTAQAIYQHWFVDFEFPDENGLPYKSNGGEILESELGDIPKGWYGGQIGDIIDVINGYAFGSSDFGTNGEYPIIKISNITPPYVEIDSVQYYSGALSSSMKKSIVEKGDILISMTGSHMHQINSAVGKVGRYNYLKPAILNQRVGKLNPKYNCLEFLFQVMMKSETQSEILMAATGSANQANISPDTINKVRVVIPPLPILELFEKPAMMIAKTRENYENQKRILGNLKDLLLSKLTTIKN